MSFFVFQNSSIPQRFRNGTWNCLEDNWEKFKPHLACNFYTQCSDGRDEDGCGYKRCHGNGFEVNGTCYILLRTLNTPHYKANFLCMDQGARLVILESVEEIRAVIRVVWKHQPFEIKVGVTSKPFETLSM